MIPTALTIAGLDPSGGAGIGADLKTFSVLKVYGMSVVTALTVQNTKSVTRVMEVPPDFVADQLNSLVGDIRPAAVKTGMLAAAEIAECVAGVLRRQALSNIVVDPVMVASVNAPLAKPNTMDAVKRFLLPLALLVTPNLEEARTLTGNEIRTLQDMEESARRIHQLGVRNVLVKGGHREGPAVDIFFDGTNVIRLQAERIATRDTHGTGCVLSAAIVSYLARGEKIDGAVHRAKDFISRALRHSLRLGAGRGPCDPIGIEAEE